MKGSERTLQTLRFRGSPIGLDALVGVPQEDFSGLPRSLSKTSISIQPTGCSSHATQGATRLRITVAPNTAPGIYKGSARVGDQMYPVEIKIQPYIHLSASPRQLVIQASAGQKLYRDLVLANTGNVTSISVQPMPLDYMTLMASKTELANVRQTQSSDRSRVDYLVDQLAKVIRALSNSE